MALKLFKVRGGLSDENRYILSGVGAPGGDGAIQDQAPVGSIYSDTSTGDVYIKKTPGAGAANWEKLAKSTDLSNLAQGFSWREPVEVHDSTTPDIATAVANANSTNTIDGVTIYDGMRVLMSGLTTGNRNVYIVTGTPGNWTFTEDTNPATPGDTLRVLNGTDAGKLFMYDANNGWYWVDAQTNAEDQYIRQFVGKSGPGAVTPTYTSTNVVANGDDLATAISKLDSYQATQDARITNVETLATARQTEIDNIEASVGLDAQGNYVQSTTAHYVANATSVKTAIEALDAQLFTTTSDLAAEVTNRQNADAAIQAELDATQAGAGLAANGAYQANANANYIANATSLADADNLLDAALKTVDNALNTEIANRQAADNAIQAELDATQAGAGLAANGAYQANANANYIAAATSLANADDLLDAALKTVENNLAAEVTNRQNADAAIQAELDATQAGAGLNVDGTYAANANANYIKNATSLADADNLLDAAIANVASSLSTETANRQAADAALQSELDATQAGAGLAANGAYQANANANYIANATSLADADNLLDAAIKTVENNLAAEVTNRQNADAAIQAELDATQTGAGLAANGAYQANANANYIANATSLANADDLLDAAIKTVENNLNTEIANRQAADTNLQNQITTVQNDLATEITNRQNADAAIDAKIGNINAYTSTTVVANGDNVVTAISKLDAAVADNISRSTLTNVTTGTLDSVLVDKTPVAKWTVFVEDATNPTNRVAIDVIAMHDGTANADATAVDYTEYAELDLGNLNVSISVTLNGTGASQTMDLVISSTTAINAKAVRMYV